MESTQSVIGNIHYSPARAVQVRDDERVPHNAVYGSVAVYSDMRHLTDALIAGWPEIMAAADAKVAEIIAANTPAQGGG
jgi:hypothetical protein